MTQPSQWPSGRCAVKYRHTTYRRRHRMDEHIRSKVCQRKIPYAACHTQTVGQRRNAPFGSSSEKWMLKCSVCRTDEGYMVHQHRPQSHHQSATSTGINCTQAHKDPQHVHTMAPRWFMSQCGQQDMFTIEIPFASPFSDRRPI